ncbi:MAG TPA: hypothetical protein VFQ12_01770 [Thermoleophilaceae bacterium]|nr:hypothetical protein [Thermoleophilaceae bacterium]
MRLEINARRVRWALLIVIAGLSVASLLAQVSRYVLEFRDVGGLVPLFDAGGEANIPTYFSPSPCWRAQSCLR